MKTEGKSRKSEVRNRYTNGRGLVAVDFSFLSEVPRPLGLEGETAAVAMEIRKKYSDFFAWVQAREDMSGVSDEEVQGTILAERIQGQAERIQGQAEGIQDQAGGVQGGNEEPWLLDKADIEYFYHLTRPADIGCACPYGWVEKVERLIDQQYPMFGVERFPDLYDKAAHMLWLIIKNEIFPDYNEGIAVLAALVLLKRNGITLEVNDEDMRSLIIKARSLIAQSKEDSEFDEDEAVRYLGAILRATASA